MKVYNLESPRSGRTVANQFIIEEEGGIMGNFIKRQTFQSYDTVIATITTWNPEDCKHRKDVSHVDIVLDENHWNYSKTTSKYRNQFLRETTEETKRKIKEGIYKLENLNK